MLILLGISLGTAATGKVIDNADANNLPEGIRRFQEKGGKGKGFLINILSDGNGISISRFQAFFFNVIFGVMFIAEFFPDIVFLNFEPEALALMGISSSAYAGIKLTENAQKEAEG